MTIKELQEKRAGIVAEARKLVDTADAEKRQMTAEEQQAWDKAMADVDSLAADIERRQRMEAAEKHLEQSAGRRTAPSDPNAGPEHREQPVKIEYRGRSWELAPNTVEWRRAQDAYARSFDAFLQRGLRSLTHDEMRDLQADADIQGGFLVAPQVMVNELIKAVDDLVHIRQLATVYPVVGADSLGAPSLDSDPDDGDWTAEIKTGSNDIAMAFGKRVLKPHPLAKRIKVSRTLMERAAIGAEALVRDRFTYKFAVTHEKAYLTGSGANQPLGVFTASPNGISTARDVSTDNTTTELTADGLINAKYSLKTQYLADPSTRWVFHRDVLRNIRKLKDGDGRYVWASGLNGTPDTILEVPYLVSEYAPNTFTAGQYVGIIGAFRHYWIAESTMLRIQRLDELYAESNQVGFIARQESDGMPVLEEAFARVTLASA